ncbi:cytochrome c [Pedobacter frigoris]|uniref:c-type cytochrome n=1 Tax=Pedobacter frigoris TaxID=2571272 RepID=UPI00292F974F|nr:cytochrome c [Pedobacter frigoris]
MRRRLLSILFLSSIGLIIYSCQNASQLKQDIYYTNGRDLYIKYCQNCHGANGEGLSALAPPLTDTVFLQQNKQKIACYIKNGLSEPITVHGRQYQEKMPDFPTLANIDIAQIIVYITNSFGNKQGHYTPEQVADDLKNCK